VTFPYALRIANVGLKAACAADPGLTEAVNMYAGKVTNRAVADTFDLKYVPFS
jgi:alanine dehydrogenase